MSGPSTTQFVAVCTTVVQTPLLHTRLRHTRMRTTSRPVRALPDLHLLRAGAAEISYGAVHAIDDLLCVAVFPRPLDQRGRVIAIPDTLVDFHTDRYPPQPPLSDAADHEGPARRDPLERGLRAEGTAGEWLDLEVGQGLAHELRHALRCALPLTALFE